MIPAEDIERQSVEITIKVKDEKPTILSLYNRGHRECLFNDQPLIMVDVIACYVQCINLRENKIQLFGKKTGVTPANFKLIVEPVETA